MWVWTFTVFCLVKIECWNTNDFWETFVKQLAVLRREKAYNKFWPQDCLLNCVFINFRYQEILALLREKTLCYCCIKSWSKNCTKADSLVFLLFTSLFVSIFFLLLFFSLEVTRQLFYSFGKISFGSCSFI